MHLMILENRRLRNTFRANGGKVTIGSDSGCSIHLPDPRIAKHQASITLDDEGLWWLEVKDLTVPTSLNRAIQKTRAKLRHADEIEFGNFAVRFFRESDKSLEERQHERILALTKSHGDSLPLGTIVHKENKELSVSRENLEQMVLLAMRLTHSETVGDTMTPILRAILRTFDGSLAWMGIRTADHGDFEWSLCQSNRGKTCVRPSFSKLMETRCMDLSQCVCCPSAPQEDIKSAMAVPLMGQMGTLGMLYVENGNDQEAFAEASLNDFKALATCVTMPIDSVLRQSMAKRRETAQTQQTIARITQDAVTTSLLPLWDELEAAAYRHMGQTNCCDFYDIVQQRDKTAAILVAKLAVTVNELPKHFAELRAAFRLAALYSEAPHTFMRALNWLLYSADAKNVVHAAAAWICPKTGKVTYCLAGKCVVIGRLTADDTCQMAHGGAAPPVGHSKSTAYDCGTFELGHGETLFVATDGVNSAENSDKDNFGITGLKETLCDGLGGPPASVLKEFATDLEDFVTNGKHPDDISVVLLRRE